MYRWGVGASILMYHSIADDFNEPYTVSIDNFHKQIAWLYKEGFEIISLSFLLQLIREKDYTRLHKKVVLTFDDGFKDFAINALPILLKYDATATVFLVTGMLGGRAQWNENGVNAQLMTEDEVRYIKKKGISLGSHTTRHVNLILEDDEGIKEQLQQSYDVLARLGETFYAFAYPWGQWSYQVVSAIKSSGYECALVVGEQMRMTSENSYLLPRITMRHDMDLKSFQLLLRRTNAEKEIRRRFWMLRDRMWNIVN